MNFFCSMMPTRLSTGRCMSLRVSVVPLLLAFSLAACSPSSQKANQNTESQNNPSPKVAPSTSTVVPTATGSSLPPQGIEAAAKMIMGNEAKVTEIEDSVIPGLKQIVINGQVFYTDPKGQYLLAGEIMDPRTHMNITSQKRDQLRVALIKQLDVKDAIVYKAKGKTLHVLNVFTDVECGYCRKFHSEIEQYTAKGLEVHYYPWPRSGTTGPIYDEMVSVWCASDSKAALTGAKNGNPPPAKTCNSPVKKYFDLGVKMGIQGTPAVFLNNGRQIGGYVPPDQILNVITPPAVGDSTRTVNTNNIVVF